MLMAFVVMGAPGAGRGSNQNGIFVRCHAVLHVSRHEQEAANGIRFDMAGIGTEGHLERSLDDCNPSVGAVRMAVVIPCGNESSISEFLSRHVGLALKHRPLRAILCGRLPLDCFSVPALRCFGPPRLRNSESTQV